MAPTLTEAGTVRAAELLLDRVTAAPVAVAGPERVTVQLVEEPPAIVVAAQASDESVTSAAVTAGAVTSGAVPSGAVTVTETICAAPAYEAVIVAVCLLLTGVVLAVKMVVVAPGAILTKAGTVTDAALLERANSAGEEEAALNDTVQVEEAPPITSLGAQLSEKMDGASVGGIIAPPVPVTVKAPPDGEAPTRFNKPIEVVECRGCQPEGYAGDQAVRNDVVVHASQQTHVRAG